MCRLHHWAFDVGWISISDDYIVLVRDDLPLNDTYAAINSLADQKILLPDDKTFAPHILFLRASRGYMGFTS